MKKTLALLTLIAFMLALPAAVIAHTEGEPFEVDLIAGGGNPASAIDAGDVLVWNDGEYLYVKYVADHWCLYETHLHVATSEVDIPQTKKGNPIPGQFDYKTDHDPCETEYVYQIPLTWSPETELYIAAHAALGCESAWAAGGDFPGKNWATYFTYTVQSSSPAEPTVTPGAPDWTKGAGVRYKGYNTGGEIFLGPMLPPSALPRVEAEYNEFQTVGKKTYTVFFSFDAEENKITAFITYPYVTLEYDFDALEEPGCPASEWDAMEILVRDSRTDSGVALQNVYLESYSLGDFGMVDRTGTPGWQNWTVAGFDFSQSFIVFADLVVDGFNGNESIKIEFNVGCLNQ